ncbi:uncharacterized protein P174DRAFT_42380 [Aspergillus novofumigatus IBT 16806]|uniref:Uncharacterized protein n=1 Tax=Aspergillus novofumigatus (strain IBT 16806) TaxID=1392255 RepID=A0A2I1CNN5_ASPN1|nr:uncharacterized protein P174DRAFT_42380 [Aspergillus novofumigatus IBT 16806]PKX99231.1 hypothetical protein P174DRAFT_42380 [Aspergillus novofumigatus IBT 16806]
MNYGSVESRVKTVQTHSGLWIQYIVIYYLLGFHPTKLISSIAPSEGCAACFKLDGTVNGTIDMVKRTCSHIISSGILFCMKTFPPSLSKEIHAGGT